MNGQWSGVSFQLDFIIATSTQLDQRADTRHQTTEAASFKRKQMRILDFKLITINARVNRIFGTYQTFEQMIIRVMFW